MKMVSLARIITVFSGIIISDSGKKGNRSPYRAYFEGTLSKGILVSGDAYSGATYVPFREHELQPGGRSGICIIFVTMTGRQAP